MPNPPQGNIPVLHAARHQDGGVDEVSVAALSGELADRQPSKAGASGLGWTDEKLLKGAGAGAAPDEIDVPVGATKQFFVPCHMGSGGALNFGKLHAQYDLDGVGDYAMFSFRLPNDFTTLISVKVIFIPNGTGTIDWTASTVFGANGEAYNVHTDSTTADGLVTTGDQLKELDISLAFTGVTANDIIGVKFLLDAMVTTTFLSVIGLDVKYA